MLKQESQNVRRYVISKLSRRWQRISQGQSQSRTL